MSMKLTLRAGRRILGGTALACAAALLPGTAMASAAAPAVARAQATHAKVAGAAWNFPRCKASQLEIWLGVGNGGGTAGTIFFPLEFSNISRHPCKLSGFPRVTAVGRRGHRIGRAARHLRSRHGKVELWPGNTAHALLGFVEAGNVCNRPVQASGLKIRAPHTGRSTQISFSFQACRHRSVLVVGPIKPGVGIP